MEDTRLTQPAKLAVLLAIVALAIAWTHACATAVRPQGEIARANHGYRSNSWFRTGLDTLRHWIFTNPDAALARWNTIWESIPHASTNQSRVVWSQPVNCKKARFQLSRAGQDETGHSYLTVIPI